ncbi:tetratricopeptide repeat protein [Pseudorhizobium sp. NPDC055634]
MKSQVRKVNKGFALATGTAVVLLSLTVSPGAQENAVPSDSLNIQNECDRLAGSPSDHQRNTAFGAVDTAQVGAGAIDTCRLAFEATGNPRFAYQLGRALNNANEIDQAMSAYEAAAEAQYPAAKVNFGMLLGRLGDHGAEFQMYSEAAEGGNVLAAYNLGVSYRDGIGTQVDVDKALHWFEAAVAGGDDTAAFNIAVIYDEGKLLPEDDQTAIAWYDLAVQRGNVDAMVNLGIMLETGEGIDPDAGQAAELYARAAERGDMFAANKILELHASGRLEQPEMSEFEEGMNSLVLKEGDMEKPSLLAKSI